MENEVGSNSPLFLEAFDTAYMSSSLAITREEMQEIDNIDSAPNVTTQWTSYTEQIARAAEFGEINSLELPKYAIAASMEKVPRRIKNAIINGNIKRAYELLAESKNPLVARVAKDILQNIGNTKISKSTNFIGKDTAGAFDPRANTIYINTEGDVSVHTLLHEGTHAITSHVIADNPTAPAVKELQKIYENTKDALSSAYGSENLLEFVAEFNTNPVFRAEVASIPYQTIKGEPVSVFQKVLDAIRRIINRFILRRPHQKIMGRGVKQIDKFIDSILSPAPVSRDAQMMRMTFKEIQKSIDELGKQAGLGKLTEGQRKESIELVKNYAKSAPAKARQLLNSFMPLNVLVEMYRKDYTEGPKGKRTNALEDLFIIIKEKVGKRQKQLAKIKDTGKQLRDLISDPKVREKMFTFMSNSTLDQMDASLDKSHYAKHWVSWEVSTKKFRTDEKGNKLGLIYTKRKKGFNSKEEREAFILDNNLSNKAVKSAERELDKARKAKDDAAIDAAQKKVDAAKADTADIRGIQRWGGNKEKNSPL